MELIRHHGVAIVGCGWAGMRHAKAFIAEGAQRRWTVDNDPARAAMIAGLRSGVRAVTSLEQALCDSTVTVVDVCTPHNQHAEICMQALAAGKDVLCEKPLAPAILEADKMVTPAEAAGKAAMCDGKQSFRPTLCANSDV